MARWKGGEFYPGAVSGVNKDGTYQVQFDDGDFEAAEPHHHMVRRHVALCREAHERVREA